MHEHEYCHVIYGPQNIWTHGPNITEICGPSWNIRTSTSAVLQVHFQVRRCRLQKKHRSDGSDIYRICLKNYSRTGHRSNSSWTKYITSLNSPRTMCVRGYLGGRGSTVNRSIARIEGAMKLTEIVIYDRSAVQYSYIRSIYQCKFHVRSGWIC